MSNHCSGVLISRLSGGGGKRERPWFIAFNNFLCVSTSTTMDFKLPKLCLAKSLNSYRLSWAPRSCCLFPRTSPILASRNRFPASLIWPIIHSGFLNQSCCRIYVPWGQRSLFKLGLFPEPRTDLAHRGSRHILVVVVLRLFSEAGEDNPLPHVLVHRALPFSRVLTLCQRQQRLSYLFLRSTTHLSLTHLPLSFHFSF